MTFIITITITITTIIIIAIIIVTTIIEKLASFFPHLHPCKTADVGGGYVR
jgi:hypothetical protein